MINTITNEEYKKLTQPFVINYGFCVSPFGECLIGITEKGICYLVFLNIDKLKALELLKKCWPNAILKENQQLAGDYIQMLFRKNGVKKLDLLLKGTSLQIRVWQALLNIACGSVSSYEEVAKSVNRACAVRAVAGAIARNRIAYLVPCHRVIHKAAKVKGVMSYNYAFGTEIKKALLEWEGAVSFQRKPEFSQKVLSC